MTYFVNLYENSYGQAGRYYTYRLYSGESVEEIKDKIARELKDDYIDFVDKDAELDTSGSFADLASSAEDILGESEDFMDYSLDISEPYTDPSKALNFYLEYAEIDQDDLEHFEEVNFYFYGDWAIKHQNFFPYMAELNKSHGVIADDRIIKFLSGI